MQCFRKNAHASFLRYKIVNHANRQSKETTSSNSAVAEETQHGESDLGSPSMLQTAVTDLHCSYQRQPVLMIFSVSVL
ncbi:hypothetical protein AWC38_SpisGene6383 [Stylophora pistillata]|uniref:Uncharacterized protein n=1 Tax=Stylophora pistillata TaxID=50429 RepID=A0A2B4SK66_STYPI|nr:hypothetical protein AWC38_SpisGene6383 [Stylophora pistillata]